MLFFELSVGVHPFLHIPTSNAVADQVTIDRLRQAHLNQAPPDPRQCNNNLPDGFGETISIALAKDPKQRYQSVQEMLEIICAIFGVPVQQIPDRLRPAAGGAQTATQTRSDGTLRVEIPSGVSGAGAFYAASSPGSPPAGATGTQFIPPSPGGGAGTQYVPPAPGGAPGGSTGTQYIQPVPGVGPAYYQSAAAAYPAAGQGPTGTQFVPAAGMPGTGVPAAGDVYPSEKARRRPWLWIGIGALAVIVVLCGIGLGAGLPVLKDMLGTQTPTPTPTFTATAIPPTETSLPTEPLPSATLPEVIQVTATLPPPPQPTQFVIPTVVPLPTQPLIQPSPTKQYGFKVTIHNNKNYPIFPFRDGRSMGGPIPAYKYIYYLSIPPGPHTFTFCLDPNRSDCPFTRQVNVDKDLDINIP
jgi:hypothetical protein